MIDEMLSIARGRQVLCVTRGTQHMRSLIEDIMRTDPTARPIITAGRERVDLPRGGSIIFASERSINRARGRHIDVIALVDLQDSARVRVARELGPLQAEIVDYSN